MDLIDRGAEPARLRAQRKLAAHMRPGEQVVTFDICRSSSDFGVLMRGRGERVDAVLSDQAVYLVQRRGVTDRLAFDQIMEVIWVEPSSDPLAALAVGENLAKLVEIRLWDDRRIALVPMGKPTDFSRRLHGSVNHLVATHHVVLMGGGRGGNVRQWLNPRHPDAFVWDFIPDEGVDASRGLPREALQRRIRQLTEANAASRSPEPEPDDR